METAGLGLWFPTHSRYCCERMGHGGRCSYERVGARVVVSHVSEDETVAKMGHPLFVGGKYPLS
jgi:hypothetical protein